jgi:hypothetical protein
MHITRMSSVQPLREVVRHLADTFNNPQKENHPTLIFMMTP